MGKRYGEGSILLDRYRLERLLGSGPHSQVYQAVDMKHSHRFVAIKIEEKLACLRTEHQVLKRFHRGSEFSCKLYDYREIDGGAVMVMELLGKDYSQLRKALDSKRFPMEVVAEAGSQMVRALQDFHQMGYVHRDVKPGNFIRRLGGSGVVLVDFGVARWHVRDGVVRERRDKADFRGTVKYASYNAHLGKDLGRRDDFFSLFFMLAEFCLGHLPWNKIEDRERVGKTKYKFCSTLTGLPEPLKEFCNTLRHLRYEECPPYDKLYALVRSLAFVPDVSDSPLDVRDVRTVQDQVVQESNVLDEKVDEKENVKSISMIDQVAKLSDLEQGEIDTAVELNEITPEKVQDVPERVSTASGTEMIIDEPENDPQTEVEDMKPPPIETTAVPEQDSEIAMGPSSPKQPMKTPKRRASSRSVRSSKRSKASDSLLNRRIKVWWKDDNAFYPGTISEELPDGTVRVLYDDGDVELLTLSQEKFKLL